jgi:hypothetical protein
MKKCYIESIWREGISYIQRKKRKVNWMGHILRGNGLLKHVVERNTAGNVKVTGRGGHRRKQLLYDLEEKRGY